MNFLAHAFLSGSDELLLLGNFIGDSVKGNEIHKYPDKVKQGIQLHRLIDKYTDNHPIFIQSSQRLKPFHGKYSVVVVDMIYDHFLAKNWQQFSNVPLPIFTKKIYFILFNHFLLLPSRSKKMLPFLMTSDWLGSYETFDGLQKRFNGMARRAKYNSQMELAVTYLKQDYESYQNEFFLFWKDIRAYVNDNNLNDLIKATF